MPVRPRLKGQHCPMETSNPMLSNLLGDGLPGDQNDNGEKCDDHRTTANRASLRLAPIRPRKRAAESDMGQLSAFTHTTELQWSCELSGFTIDDSLNAENISR